MAADRELALHASLPTRYDHLEVLASSIDRHGRLVALLAGHAPAFPVEPYDAIAVIVDGRETHEIPAPGLDQWFTHIDTIGDGVVLVAARAGRQTIPHQRFGEPVPESELVLHPNVRVLDRDGGTSAEFYAGDAVEQAMTDERGDLWIGYFDESSLWLPQGDGTRRWHSMPGLVRWSAGGELRWFAPADPVPVFWVDCYALNVGRDLVRACPYVDFPLVEIDGTGIRVSLTNEASSCSGLAAAGDRFGLLHQHRAGQGFRWDIRHARREGATVVETGRERLVLPDGSPPGGWARGKIGRDGTLWMHVAGDPRRWYRYELDA